MSNNPEPDLVNINVYENFGQIPSICSHDIERKRNSDLNQGPQLGYEFIKNDL